MIRAWFSVVAITGTFRASIIARKVLRKGSKTPDRPPFGTLAFGTAGTSELQGVAHIRPPSPSLFVPVVARPKTSHLPRSAKPTKRQRQREAITAAMGTFEKLSARLKGPAAKNAPHKGVAAVA
jgi:hypothetical protein